MLTGSSKDIEKQIQGIQENSEKIKGEVRRFDADIQGRQADLPTRLSRSRLRRSNHKQQRHKRICYKTREINEIPNSLDLLGSCRLRYIVVKGQSQGRC